MALSYDIEIGSPAHSRRSRALVFAPGSRRGVEGLTFYSLLGIFYNWNWRMPNHNGRE